LIRSTIAVFLSL